MNDCNSLKLNVMKRSYKKNREKDVNCLLQKMHQQDLLFYCHPKSELVNKVFKSFL